jgi:hypothetical protein
MVFHTVKLKYFDISNCPETKILRMTNINMHNFFIQVMDFRKIQRKQLDISNCRMSKVGGQTYRALGSAMSKAFLDLSQRANFAPSSYCSGAEKASHHKRSRKDPSRPAQKENRDPFQVRKDQTTAIPNRPVVPF